MKMKYLYRHNTQKMVQQTAVVFQYEHMACYLHEATALQQQQNIKLFIITM